MTGGRRSRLLIVSACVTAAVVCAAAGRDSGIAAQSPSSGAGSSLSPSAVLIRSARTLADTGQFRESAAAWQRIAAAEPALAQFAYGESIRGLLAAGDLQAALNGLSQLDDAPAAELLLRLADASRSAGMLDGAAGLYRRARSQAGRTRVADEAAIGLAATLEQGGKPLEALETFRDLQLTFRQPSAYDTADGAARRLSAQLGGAGTLSEADYDAIAARLAGAAAFRRAVDVLIQWRINFPTSVKAREIDASTVSYLYSLRANEEARARAYDFLALYPDSSEAHSVAITLFRLDVREGKTADVERRGRAIFTGEVSGTELSDRQGAGRLLAEYLVSIGQPARALTVYDQLYRITPTRGDRVDVLWRTAIAALRAGSRTRAISVLKQVLALKPDSETERAATYWMAHAQDAAGEKPLARALWTGLVKRYPFSYYGGRAAARLGTPLPAASLTFQEPGLRDVVLAHPAYRATSLLAEAGLLPDAAVYARRLNGAFRRDDAVALLTARACAAAGDHASASTLMSSYFAPYLERPATGLPADFWALAYPRAFWSEVTTAGERHKVDPLLMLALARQESHFDPAARSPVGAIGLFQIMPYTAAELDPAFALSGATERLTDPAVSAELAASLLERLLALYGNAAAPTIASYNADKERVQVWAAAAKGLPEELFIDSIPYRETRAYVRQVLANFAMFQRFAAQSASPQR